jgi:hypothetical protein
VISGESREQALDLVRKMEVSQRFKQTQIESERSEVQPTSGDHVLFDLSAQYIPSGETSNSGGGSY